MPTAKQKTPENESEAMPGPFGVEARGSGRQACCTARLPLHRHMQEHRSSLLRL